MHMKGNLYICSITICIKTRDDNLLTHQFEEKQLQSHPTFKLQWINTKKVTKTGIF